MMMMTTMMIDDDAVRVVRIICPHGSIKMARAAAAAARCYRSIVVPSAAAAARAAATAARAIPFGASVILDSARAKRDMNKTFTFAPEDEETLRQGIPFLAAQARASASVTTVGLQSDFVPAT